MEREHEAPDAAEWKHFLRQAKAFRKQAPWTDMQGDDLFAVDDPVSGRRLYACVLGMDATYYALNVYPDMAGVYGHLALLGMDQDSLIAEQHIMGQQSIIQVEFTSRDALTKEDRAQIKKAGVSFRGRNHWPQTLRYVPGLQPRDVTGEELRLLQVVMEQTMDLAERVQADELDVAPLYDHETGDLTLIVRVPTTAKDGSIAWRDAWERLTLEDTDDEASAVLPFDELRLTRLRRSVLPLQGEWEVHSGYLMMPLQPEPGDDLDRPFLPHVQAIVDRDSGTVLHMSVCKPAKAAETLHAEILNVIEAAGMAPKAFAVQTAEARAAVTTVADTFGLTINYGRPLTRTEQVLTEIVELERSGGFP